MYSGPYVFQWFLEACRATAWCAAQADDFQKTLKNNCTRDHFARKRFYQKILKNAIAQNTTLVHIKTMVLGSGVCEHIN